MPDARVIQQVSGILGMNNVEFRADDSKQTLMARFGSTVILVSLVDYQESTLVQSAGDRPHAARRLGRASDRRSSMP